MNADASSRTRRGVLLRAVAAVGVGVTVSLSPAARADSLRVGYRAPPATLVTLDSRRITTSDLAGQVVILTFWATWCGPCRQELPLLSAYAKQHSKDGLTILGFSLDTSEDLHKVRTAAQSLDFPVGLLANSSVPGYAHGRIWRAPLNFAIDRQGRLIDNGWKDKQATWTPERLERIVTPLLASR